jgi:hypothetical protein
MRNVRIDSALRESHLTLPLLVALVGLADDAKDAIAPDDDAVLADAFDA